MEPNIIKPNKTAFITSAIIRLLLGIVILVSFFILIPFTLALGETPNGSYEIYIVISIIACFFFIPIVLEILNLFVKYKKEEYTINKDRIMIKKGGIFSDTKIELAIKNITFVDLELPFFEHLLFNTGKISITSSATGMSTSVIMSSLLNYKEKYDLLIKLMQENGFMLKQDKKVFETRPDTIGIILNILRKSKGPIIGFSAGLITYIGYYSILSKINLIQQNNTIIPLLLFIAFIITAFIIVIRYLDLKKRRYQIFADSVVYYKGFLTKHKAFIPVENLSDSVTNQTFMQTLFGVYDIEVSSKGIASEIRFKNLTKGRELEEAIDSIVIGHQKELHSTPQISIKPSIKKIVINKDEKLWTPSNFTTVLKMNLVSNIFSSISSFLPSFIAIFIFMSVGSFEGLDFLMNLLCYGGLFLFGIFTFFVNRVIQILFTKYKVGENSIKEEYKFLTTTNKEFNLQKITAVIIVRSLLDRLLNTCSIRFISIGSSSDITFKHINYDPKTIEDIKLKFGFNDSLNTIETKQSHFSFIKMLQRDAVGLIFILTTMIPIIILLAIGIGYFLEQGMDTPIIIAVLIILLFSLVYPIKAIYNHYYHQRTNLLLYKNHIALKLGLINLSESYARYDNIKDMSATKWPFTNSGSLQINIAGDQMPQVQKNQHNQNTEYVAIGMVNMLKIEFIDAVHQELDNIEKFLDQDEQNIKNEIIHTTKSNFLNTISILAISSLFFFPLIILTIITYIGILKRSYMIGTKRIMEKSGIINITLKSILNKKIDNIHLKEYPINKLFKNGSIIIETAGSLAPEMIISDIDDYKKVYELISNKYNKKEN